MPYLYCGSMRTYIYYNNIIYFINFSFYRVNIIIIEWNNIKVNFFIKNKIIFL